MSNIPIFLSADNNYAPFVATTIASVCDNTKSFCDFYILDGGITEENKTKICELKKQFDNFDIEFLTISLSDLASISYQNTGNWISVSTYNRFLIPQLKPEINRALYSDVDVVVLGDIAEMYNEDLHGYALGAVWEEYAENSANVLRKKRLGLSDQHKYFSAGNLLIDCQNWRKNNISQHLFDVEKKNREKLQQADMDVLNIFFENNYQMLSPKYCWINQNFSYYNADSDIIIRHFNGKVKPWHISPDIQTSLLPNKDDFWKYAKMTSFYGELYGKTTNKEKQSQLVRFLSINKAFEKKKYRNFPAQEEI